MKKTLSLFLAVLIVLSTLAMSVSALDKTAEVFFMVDDEVIARTEMIIGEGDLSAFVPADPKKESTNRSYEYIFKGWQLKGDDSGELYQKNTIKDPTEEDAGKKITYIAVFSQKKVPFKQTVQSFLTSVKIRFQTVMNRIMELLNF